MILHVHMMYNVCVYVCVHERARECRMAILQHDVKERDGKRVRARQSSKRSTDTWEKNKREKEREVNRTGYEKKRLALDAFIIIFNICIFIYTYIIYG